MFRAVSLCIANYVDVLVLTPIHASPLTFAFNRFNFLLQLLSVFKVVDHVGFPVVFEPKHLSPL